ncbi:MAG: adenylate/guanylate cyclase domain-containing protein [Limnothrix sp.]|nr:adenylate/guanylate cyclase domain-containing protein [Limnothrix sp.]
MKSWAKMLKRWVWQWRGVLLAVPTATGFVLGMREVGLLQGLEWLAYDQMLQARPAEAPDQRVAIVGITDADLQRFGTTTLPDGVYAQAIERLKAMGPRAIGLDIYRDLPQEPGHANLVRLFNNTDYLVGIAKVRGETAADRVAAPPALAAKGQVGTNDFVVDADGKVRRVLIDTQDTENNKIYGLGLYLALLYLYPENVAPEAVAAEPGAFQLKNAIFRRFRSHDGGYIRANDAGNQLLLNYRGGSGSFETVSLRDLVDGKLPTNWARDRVVLIGNISESGRDLFLTPYSGKPLELPQRMAGVEIHAHFTSEVIAAALDNRPLLTTWQEPIEWLWIVGWAAIGSTLAWLLRLPDSRRWIAIWGIGGSGGLVLLLWGICQGAMIQGLWVPFVPPLLSWLVGATMVALYLARTAGQIRNTFGRYLNNEVVANLLEDPEGLKMGGERRKITILTSDLRGFTATAERLPPERVIEIINLYLEAMADAITDFQGTIDEFMGDGILVLFGAPTTRSDDGKRAIACAIAMQQAMGGVNAKMREMGYQPLEMGIGINTGEVVVGNIGSYKRAKYGVVGAQVNLTYRIESYTIGGQILITESALEEAGGSDYVKIAATQQVQPKGVPEPITIYDVGGVGAPYHLTLERAQETYYPIAPLQFTAQPLDGKHVSSQAWAVALVELSTKGGWLKIQGAINPASKAPAPNPQALTKPLTNLKLNLAEASAPDTLPPGPENREVYVKVLPSPDRPDHVLVQFTSKSPALGQWLQSLGDRAQATASESNTTAPQA